MAATPESIRAGLRCLSRDSGAGLGGRGYAFALHGSDISLYWTGERCVYLTTQAGVSIPVSWAMFADATPVFCFVGMPTMQVLLLPHPEEVGRRDAPITRVRVVGRATPPGGERTYDFEWWVSAEGATPSLFWAPKRPLGWPP